MFDPKINSLHIQECLKQLLLLYSDNTRGEGHHHYKVSVTFGYRTVNLGGTTIHSMSWPKVEVPCFVDYFYVFF